jgi:LysR family glycine cleavage system transcriptional activator
MTLNKLPPLNSLKAFEAAGRLKSFSRAAAELNVSSGAVSRHIQQLEAWLGFALFTRRHRGVELTEEGTIYLREASEAFSRLGLATSSMRQRRTHRIIRVNSSATFTFRWLLPNLSKFQKLHPEIEVRIQASTEPMDNIGSPFDIAIRPGRRAAGSQRTFDLLSGGLLPYCSPRLLAERPINSVSDLAQHTLLHVAPHSPAWPQWLAKAGAADLTPLHSQTFEEAYVAIQAAIDGVGITIAPKVFVVSDLLEGRLTAPFSGPIVSTWRSWRYYAYVAEGLADDPAIVQFLDWLQETGRD